MSIEYHSYKVEFAMRGAGHIHGVLWVDWEKFVKKHTETFNEDIVDEDGVIIEVDTSHVKLALQHIKDDQKLSKSETKALEKFADLFI